MQSLHGLSDFETVQELRCDLRWKAACGLGLHDTAFDPSLLTYFRRLQRSGDPNRLFHKVREVVAATGVLKGRQRRALDSTVLDDAVSTQDTVTQLVAAIRRVIREVPHAEQTAATWCTAHDYTDPGKPKIAWNDEAARADLVDALVTDALPLLGRLPEQQAGEAAANALGLLALVAGQDVEPADDSDGRDGRWRIAQGTVRDRTVSTVDPETRHIHKNRTRHQEGFRAHVAFEPEAGVFTDVTLTTGSGADNHEAAVAKDLLAEEDAPVTALGDAAYGTGLTRTSPGAGAQPGPEAAAAQPGDPQRVHRRRLHHRHRAGPGDLPRRTHRRARPALGERLPPGPVQEAVRHLPAQGPLHPLQDRPRLQRPRPVRPAQSHPRPGRRRPRMAGRVPPLATTGRTRHRLARRQGQPPRPLPRRHQERHLARQPRRRPQPPPPHQPRTHPRRRHLDDRHDHRMTRGATRPSTGRPLGQDLQERSRRCHRHRPGADRPALSCKLSATRYAFGRPAETSPPGTARE